MTEIIQFDDFPTVKQKLTKRQQLLQNYKNILKIDNENLKDKLEKLMHAYANSQQLNTHLIEKLAQHQLITDKHNYKQQEQQNKQKQLKLQIKQERQKEIDIKKDIKSKLQIKLFQQQLVELITSYQQQKKLAQTHIFQICQLLQINQEVEKFYQNVEQNNVIEEVFRQYDQQQEQQQTCIHTEAIKQVNPNASKQKITKNKINLNTDQKQQEKENSNIMKIINGEESNSKCDNEFIDKKLLFDDENQLLDNINQTIEAQLDKRDDHQNIDEENQIQENDKQLSKEQLQIILNKINQSCMQPQADKKISNNDEQYQVNSSFNELQPNYKMCTVEVTDYKNEQPHLKHKQVRSSSAKSQTKKQSTKILLQQKIKKIKNELSTSMTQINNQLEEQHQMQQNIFKQQLVKQFELQKKKQTGLHIRNREVYIMKLINDICLLLHKATCINVDINKKYNIQLIENIQRQIHLKVEEISKFGIILNVNKLNNNYKTVQLEVKQKKVVSPKKQNQKIIMDESSSIGNIIYMK